jgi:serine/threonine-protein kinase RsbW
VFVPLLAAEEVVGCLQMQYRPGELPGPGRYPDLDAYGLLCAAAVRRAGAQQSEHERRSFLLDAWAAVAEAGGYADTLRRLAAVAVPRLADLCLIDVVEPGHRFKRMAAVHADPLAAPLVAELGERYPPEPGGLHPANDAMAQGRSRWSATMPDEFLIATTRDARHYQLVKELGFQSYMCVPLVAGGDVLGAVTLVSASPQRRFGEADLALAEELASRVARVVAAARQHDREHQLVHDLQRLLLPERLPYSPGVEMTVRYLTAAAEAEAGGDFYDVVVLPSERLGFMIGDVEGHDAMAAAYMGQLRSASRALAGQVPEPGLLVDALCWSWDLLGFSRTATAIFGCLDPSSGDVVLASAGHLPPVLVRGGGGAELLPVPPSPPLGVAAGGAVSYRFTLDEGDALFLYTDGLVEDRKGSLGLQLDELVSFLGGLGQAPLEEMCDRAVAALGPRGPRRDDVAVLVMRRLRRFRATSTGGA